MARRARLTVLELGASPMAWASSPESTTDDWIVVAQQSDEPARDFSERVRHRAERLCKEEASIEFVDVYAGVSHNDPLGSLARCGVIAALGSQMASGGNLTVWSASTSEDQGGLASILAQFGPALARRQIAVNHQSYAPEHRSGVRHTIPTRDSHAPDEFAFEELAITPDPHR